MRAIHIHSNKIRDARAELRRQLQSAESTQAIDHLLCHHLSCSRAELYTKDGNFLNKTSKQKLIQQLSEWRGGKPLAQLLGSCQFFSRRFEVSDKTFIPRPETEQLVERALFHTRPASRALDLGTGCGAIAVSMACEDSSLEITATDLSDDCLTIAKRNAEAHAVRSIRFLRSDWFQRIPPQQFNTIVSNPPYVAERDPFVEESVLNHEPRMALLAGGDGLDAARVIIAQAKDWLTENGVLLLEHGWRQSQAIAALMAEAGLCFAERLSDHQGHPRVSAAFYRPGCGATDHSTPPD